MYYLITASVDIEVHGQVKGLLKKTKVYPSHEILSLVVMATEAEKRNETNKMIQAHINEYREKLEGDIRQYGSVQLGKRDKVVDIVDVQHTVSRLNIYNFEDLKDSQINVYDLMERFVQVDMQDQMQK